MALFVLGAAQFGLNYGINNQSGQTSILEVEKLLEVAWQNGIKEIDTAQDYGTSEEVLGECLKKCQRNFIVHSKFTVSDISLQDAVTKSLKGLGIKTLGYFYFHKFSDYLVYRSQHPEGEPLLDTLGLAVSVYDEAELSIAINDSFIKAIQIPLNIFDSGEEKLRLIKKSRRQGQKIYVRSVFLQGLFFMDPDSLPEKLKLFAQPLIELTKISKKYDLSLTSLALGFVKAIADVDGVLIGVETTEQLQQNLKYSQAELSQQIIDDLRRIYISDRQMLLPKNWN